MDNANPAMEKSPEAESPLVASKPLLAYIK